jgi:hypothetical protein
MNAKYELDRLMRNDTLGCTLLACMLAGMFASVMF